MRNAEQSKVCLDCGRVVGLQEMLVSEGLVQAVQAVQEEIELIEIGMQRCNHAPVALYVAAAARLRHAGETGLLGLLGLPPLKALIRLAKIAVQGLRNAWTDLGLWLDCSEIGGVDRLARVRVGGAA